MADVLSISPGKPARETGAPAAPRRRFVRLHRDDNVVIAVASLPTGAELEGEGVKVARAVSSGHKVATALIPSGAPVRKFGQIIGYATQEISPGTHVHVHN
jgi:altronate hydrolase